MNFDVLPQIWSICILPTAKIPGVQCAICGMRMRQRMEQHVKLCEREGECERGKQMGPGTDWYECARGLVSQGL